MTDLIRDNAESMYRQIATQLRDEIAAGSYDPSGRLPSEAEVGARFAVSRVTVRLALELLEQERLIERRKGKGTFIVGRQLRHPLDTLRSFHESLRRQGLNASMRLLSATTIRTPAGSAASLGQYCLRIRRLHLVDGEAVAVGCSLVPARLAAHDWRAAEHQPIYAILEEITGKEVRRADIELRAQQASARDCRELGVAPGQALLIMARTSFFTDGTCADSSIFSIRPERYSFVLSHRFLPDLERKPDAIRGDGQAKQ